MAYVYLSYQDTKDPRDVTKFLLTSKDRARRIINNLDYRVKIIKESNNRQELKQEYDNLVFRHFF